MAYNGDAWFAFVWYLTAALKLHSLKWRQVFWFCVFPISNKQPIDGFIGSALISKQFRNYFGCAVNLWSDRFVGQRHERFRIVRIALRRMKCNEFGRSEMVRRRVCVSVCVQVRVCVFIRHCHSISASSFGQLSYTYNSFACACV